MLSAVWGAGGPGAGGAARGQPSRKELVLRHHLWSRPRCLLFPPGSLPASLLGLPGVTSHVSCWSPNLASGLAPRGTQTQSVLLGEARLSPAVDGGVRGARKRSLLRAQHRTGIVPGRCGMVWKDKKLQPSGCRGKAGGVFCGPSGGGV
uniref:Uncharacterized protein n=2 Tax=Rhinopithecus TaxID=542827 RepID=A0A2K6K4E5_RHIBE